MNGTGTAETMPTFSLRDVGKHKYPHDAWTVVDGRVLDITSFISQHPGGDVITLAAGVDASILFHSYHPTGVPEAHLERLAIGKLAVNQANRSYYAPWDASPFYKTLQQRVVQKLRSLGKSRRGGIEIWVKALLLLAVFWVALATMIVSSDNFWTRAVPASVIMGATASFIGTCVQHDGNHGAFAKASWINSLAVCVSLSVLLVSSARQW